MSDLLKFVLGASWLTGLVGGILLVVRQAIATAVTQAGAREIERLKGELATQLERERQAFAREVERERQSATRDLELFKAELSKQAEVRRELVAREIESSRADAQRALEGFKAELTHVAEVRRQVAIRKVDALLAIVEAGDDLFVQLFGGEQNDVDKVIAALRPYSNRIRAAECFFPGEVVGRLRQYAGALLACETDWRNAADPSAFAKARNALEAFLTLAREELHIQGISRESSVGEKGE